VTVAKAAGFNSVIDDQSVIRINNTTVKEINYDKIGVLFGVKNFGKPIGGTKK